MSFQLPDLPYAHDALEPHMSRETLEYHHDKHHQGYVDKTNKLLGDSSVTDDGLEEIVKTAHHSNDDLFNNAAQHYNHSLFWNWMKPQGGGAMPGELDKLIGDQFSSQKSFREKFIDKGKSQFGSGWVWLAAADDGLLIMSTPNGENPLVHGATPLLGCDVWEHSYYLDHRNDRAAYLATFFDKLVNWEAVAERLAMTDLAA